MILLSTVYLIGALATALLVALKFREFEAGCRRTSPSLPGGTVMAAAVIGIAIWPVAWVWGFIIHRSGQRA